MNTKQMVVALIVALSTLACSNESLHAQLAPQKTIRVEAESGELTLATISRERNGFSGSGYVTGLTQDGARSTVRFQASKGLYAIFMRAATPNGEKGYEISVNGLKMSGMLPPNQAFFTQRAGRTELKDGENVLTIEKGWGWHDVDYVEFLPLGKPSAPKPVPLRLADKKASPETIDLMSRLIKDYGKKIWTGQYGEKDCETIRSLTGLYPAIYGGDFMDYSPSRLAFGADPKGETEKLINKAKSGHAITVSWHWNAPKALINKVYEDDKGRTIDASWYKGFYANATTFDLEKAMGDSQSEEYRLILRDIDAIAVQLKKLAAAKVPVLWRPLHEADGKWFWWGAKGPEPCIKLWRLLFYKLTNKHQLHNLIWVWNSPSPDWYPGDDVVDIVSIDAYPSDPRDPLAASWDHLIDRFDGKKLLAVSEFGGVPDVDRMFRYGCYWSHFVTWNGTLNKNSESSIRDAYRSKHARNKR